MYPFVPQHVLDILFQSKCLCISEKEENIFWLIFLDKEEDGYWIVFNNSQIVIVVLTQNEQFFSHIMTRTKCIQQDGANVRFVLD